jgi:hypothetical protein
MTEKVQLSKYYKLLAKAIESDNENVKDALETMLMITAIHEGTAGSNPFNEVLQEIDILRKEIDKLRIDLYKRNSYQEHDVYRQIYTTDSTSIDQKKWNNIMLNSYNKNTSNGS